MKRPKWIRRAIAAGDAFHVRTKRPLRHNAINLSLFVLVLSGFVLVSSAVRWLSTPVYLALASPAFAWLIFSLFVLVVHEASHDMFVVTTSRRTTRRLNRIFGWACAAPFGMDFGQHWARGHVVHHSQPCEPADPQNCSVLVGRKLLREVALVVLVPGYIHWRARRGVGISYACPAVGGYAHNRVFTAFKLAFWIAFVTAALYLGAAAVPIAVLLGLQIGSGLQLVKVALEHGGDFENESDPFLRSRTSLFPFRRVVMPLNISLHFQHHLNAGVPWYELSRYGEALRGIVPPELQPRFFSKKVWNQLRGEKGASWTA